MAMFMRQYINEKFVKYAPCRFLSNSVENVLLHSMGKRMGSKKGTQIQHIRNCPNQVLNSKSIIHNFYQLVCSQYKNPALKPLLHFKNIARKKSSPLWQAKLTLSWPVSITLESTGPRKSDAEFKVFGEAIQKLQEMKLLTENFKPELNSPEDIRKFIVKQRVPFPISMDSSLQTQIEYYLKNFQKSDYFYHSDKFNSCSNENRILIDVLTGKPYYTLDEMEEESRNQNLFNAMRTRKDSLNPDLIKLQEIRESLPVMDYKDEILRLIKKSQIIILSGETGCGKTTQVPQFIFDDFIQNLQGSECNIVVTQPRRLSAISIAARVADERGEQLRDSVGYQVRLNSMLLRKRGGIIFCSTGILLRRLQDNPDLKGVSHVIIDEAHERDVMIDFVLVLLKDVASRNKALRIIIMSASMNAQKLASFFNNCPIIDIPGRLYPVKDFYLEDIVKLIGDNKRLSKKSTDMSINFDEEMVVDLIRWIDSRRPAGAILCFLPGWQEIQSIKKGLQCVFGGSDKHLIYPVHSHVTHSDQYLIFNRPPKGVRKIILSTNIAETSITIEDVIYVIDSGLHKQTVFNPDWGTASLSRTWISKANVKQRKGRAGRTRPGECYHLFPKNFLNELDEFPTPEIQRTSLENIVIDTKVYCSDHNHASEFLTRCPDPPSVEAVKDSVDDLQERGFLTYNEELTKLGLCVTKFSLHPYLAKAIIYSVWLRCLDPVLTIVAYLTTGREPLLGTIENRDEIREAKLKFENNSNSDHLTIFNMVHEWLEFLIEDRSTVHSLCQQHFINNNSMKFITGLKTSLMDQIREFLPVENEENENSMATFNSYSSNREMVVSALCAAFAPNFLRCLRGEVTKSRTISDNVWYKMINGGRAKISKESVNVLDKRDLGSPSWLTFFHKMRSAESGLMLIRDTSAVPAIAILLFAGVRVSVNKIKIKEQFLIDQAIRDPVELCIDDEPLLRFCCSKDVANHIVELRHKVQCRFESFLCDLYNAMNTNSRIIWQREDELLLELLNKCLEVEQKHR